MSFDCFHSPSFSSHKLQSPFSSHQHCVLFPPIKTGLCCPHLLDVCSPTGAWPTDQGLTFFFRENWAFLSQNLWAVNSSLARGGISYCSPFSMVLFSFAQVFCTVNCTTLWVHLCNCPDVSRRHRFWAAIHWLCLLHSVFHLLCYDTRVSGGASQHICSA